MIRFLSNLGFDHIRKKMQTILLILCVRQEYSKYSADPVCKTGCNACGGYWIKEPQSVTLTQIANACSRHEQQFTEQQQDKHENNNNDILKHVDVIGCQRFLRTPNNTKHSHHISFVIFRCGCPFEMVGC